MKIFVLTPIYAITTSMQGATPVVHYFTREWVKMGHDVTVFHFVAKYPWFMYWIGRHFQHKLNTKFGMLVPVQCPSEEDYVAEGVSVHRRCLKKLIPHSRYSKKQIRYALELVAQDCNRCGIPDWFIGHWDNPQLELLDALKQQYAKPTCLVLHDNIFNYKKKYGKDGLKMLSKLDVVGFRNLTSQRHYEEKYGKPLHSFVASSGVSESFLKAGTEFPRLVQQPIRHFVFVGSLIARKYPVALVTALSRVFPDGDFTLTFIGDGAEKTTIEEEHRRLGCLGEVKFTGRIPREEIIQYLKQADVFIMISRGEIFGLVYLEAMALGLIPIGSKNEGIDGIIRNGENGFLCEAGNVDELSCILWKINEMSLEQLQSMSNSAKETACKYSDKGVANRYLNSLL